MNTYKIGTLTVAMRAEEEPDFHPSAFHGDLLLVREDNGQIDLPNREAYFQVSEDYGGPLATAAEATKRALYPHNVRMSELFNSLSHIDIQGKIENHSLAWSFANQCLRSSLMPQLALALRGNAQRQRIVHWQVILTWNEEFFMPECKPLLAPFTPFIDYKSEEMINA